MPIYEFKCRTCGELVEFLFKNPEDQVALKCPKCGGEGLERVLSTTHYAMGSDYPKGAGASSQTRTCSSGSCTTYDVPGPTR